MRKPYRRTSGTKIALISIILIAVSWFFFMLVYFDVEKDINYIPFLIITGIIIFALIVILSIIKIDSVKAIRNSDIDWFCEYDFASKMFIHFYLMSGSHF